MICAATVTALALSLSVFPGIAEAHAFLVRSTPAAGAVLRSSPARVVATFAEGVDPKGSFLRVFAASGDREEVDAANSSVSFSDVKQMSVGLPRLRKGVYLVMWFTVSADDGHRAGGAFTFTIR